MLLQNGVKFVQKLIPGFKNHMTNSENLRQALKGLTFEFWWATFDQKILNIWLFDQVNALYIMFSKTLYTEHLSKITLNYLRRNSPNSLRHFWNHSNQQISFPDSSVSFKFKYYILLTNVAHQSANFQAFYRSR